MTFKRWWLVWSLLVVGGPSVSAMGLNEDPLDQLTKTWKLEAVRSLEIRGEIDFEIVVGPQPRVTVETSRALFDQLTVSNWFGAATVAIESGLRGPRERGTVRAIIEVPTLGELAVFDKSSGRVTWPPGLGASLRVGENSTVSLAFEGKMLTIEASWLSSVQIQGRTEFLSAGLRHQSRLNAQKLQTGTARLSMDENSAAEMGPTDRGTGLARHGSQLTVVTLAPWASVEVREDSILKARME